VHKLTKRRLCPCWYFSGGGSEVGKEEKGQLMAQLSQNIEAKQGKLY
jgi:hypothetical protein